MLNQGSYSLSEKKFPDFPWNSYSFSLTNSMKMHIFSLIFPKLLYVFPYLSINKISESNAKLNEDSDN